MNNPTHTSLSVVLTGATGMVGEGVLLECLGDTQVERVLVVNRRSCGMVHPKLTEILHADFFDLSPIESRLAGYNACFFCLGVSSVGMKEPRFRHYTYDLTMHMAKLLSRLNRDMTFCYISGTGTDSSEKGRMMWARVKGRTENDLMKLPFAQVYNFRPGIMRPTPGAKNTLASYRYLMWLLPVIQWLAPHHICRLSDVGRAMIHAATRGYEKHILEIRDILLLSKDGQG